MAAAPYNPDTDPLIQKVTASVKEHMSKYDASHDWAHIQRVVGLARHIASLHPDTSATPPLNLRLVNLSALLHDIGDRKYTSASAAAADPYPIKTLLLSLNSSRTGDQDQDQDQSCTCDEALASAVQEICSAVSWHHEKANPALVARVLAAHPELGVVQDADRLDAIGAVGLGRLFTYGGARVGRSLEGSMEHLTDKLLKVQARLKTDAGRELGRERTERLLRFQEWFVEETAFAVRDLGGGEMVGDGPAGKGLPVELNDMN